MARILNIEVPNNKRIVIALTSIFGIGKSLSEKILEEAKISVDKKTKDLTDEELNQIRTIARQYKLEGDLRREVSENIKRLMDINAYRGRRHRQGLPVRGQSSKTNARTRKGPRKTVANKKVASK